MEALTLEFQPIQTMVQSRHLTRSSLKQMTTRVETMQVVETTPEAEMQEVETLTHLGVATMLVVETTPEVETLTPSLGEMTKVEMLVATQVGMPTHSLVVTKVVTQEQRVEMPVATLEPMVGTQVQMVVKTQLLANLQQTTP